MADLRKEFNPLERTTGQLCPAVITPSAGFSMLVNVPGRFGSECMDNKQEIQKAIRQLNKSKRGQRALGAVRVFMEYEFMRGLDSKNNTAVAVLVLMGTQKGEWSAVVEGIKAEVQSCKAETAEALPHWSEMTPAERQAAWAAGQGKAAQS